MPSRNMKIEPRIGQIAPGHGAGSHLARKAIKTPAATRMRTTRHRNAIGT